MRVTLDRGRCQGVGMCDSIRPDLFELDDGGELVVHHDAIGADDVEDLRQAVESCPTQALGLTE